MVIPLEVYAAEKVFTMRSSQLPSPIPMTRKNKRLFGVSQQSSVAMRKENS